MDNLLSLLKYLSLSSLHLLKVFNSSAWATNFQNLTTTLLQTVERDVDSPFSLHKKCAGLFVISWVKILSLTQHMSFSHRDEFY